MGNKSLTLLRVALLTWMGVCSLWISCKSTGAPSGSEASSISHQASAGMKALVMEYSTLRQQHDEISFGVSQGDLAAIEKRLDGILKQMRNKRMSDLDKLQNIYASAREIERDTANPLPMDSTETASSSRSLKVSFPSPYDIASTPVCVEFVLAHFKDVLDPSNNVAREMIYEALMIRLGEYYSEEVFVSLRPRIETMLLKYVSPLHPRDIQSIPVAEKYVQTSSHTALEYLRDFDNILVLRNILKIKAVYKEHLKRGGKVSPVLEDFTDLFEVSNDDQDDFPPEL